MELALKIFEYTPEILTFIFLGVPFIIASGFMLWIHIDPKQREEMRQIEKEMQTKSLAPLLPENPIDWSKVALGAWNVSVWSVKTQGKIVKALEPSDEVIARAAAVGGIAGTIATANEIVNG